MVKLLFVLETLENPSGLALYKLAIFISVCSKSPYLFHKVCGWMLTHVNEIIYIVINPGLVLAHFCFPKIDGDIGAAPAV